MADRIEKLAYFKFFTAAEKFVVFDPNRAELARIHQVSGRRCIVKTSYCGRASTSLILAKIYYRYLTGRHVLHLAANLTKELDDAPPVVDMVATREILKSHGS